MRCCDFGVQYSVRGPVSQHHTVVKYEQLFSINFSFFYAMYHDCMDYGVDVAHPWPWSLGSMEAWAACTLDTSISPLTTFNQLSDVT